MKYDRNQFEPPLDPGIERAVVILHQHGIETYESCQGGEGHACPSPTVLFHGTYADGFRALSIALAHGMPVSELQRFWSVQDHEPVGPHWKLVFYKQVALTDEEINWWKYYEEGG